jgi:hypothetical protein
VDRLNNEVVWDQWVGKGDVERGTIGNVVTLASGSCAFVERVRGQGGEGAEGKAEELVLELEVYRCEADFDVKRLACC